MGAYQRRTGMKYIRTKDGIHKVKSWHDYDLSGRVYETEDKQFIDAIEVMKVGNTIEELCDEFVWTKHLGNETYRKFYEKVDIKNKVLINNDSKLHYQPRKELEIYGAIWTEWGLKYVAKMNDEGELELV